MPMVPVNFKMEKAEADALEREAKTVPRRTLSAYVREIVQKRRKPKMPQGNGGNSD